MDFFDSDNITDTIFYFPLITNGTDTITTATCSTVVIVDDKDWRPYRHFEYDPIWHKKFASIKYQMETMWG